MTAPVADHRKAFEDLKRTLTIFQKTLHEPEDTKKGPDHPGNQVLTAFYSTYRKTTWHYHHPERLDVTSSETGFSFRAKPQPHGLLYSDIVQVLPSIVCNPGYEARWTHNPGSNVIETGAFVFNDKVLQSIDYIYNDIHGQSMIEEKDRDIRSINLGNLAMLQDWNTALPTYTTSFMPPWFYASSLSAYFPLYFCGFLDRIEHRLKLRRNVSDLLLVRQVADEKGELPTPVRVALDTRSIRSINSLPPVADQLKLKSPEMWAEYLYLSDIECTNNLCMTNVGASLHKVGDYRNVLHIEDMIAMDDPNPVALGSTVSVKCENSEYPVHAFAWVAQNETAKSQGYYSNYSTNTEDCLHGWSPLQHATINAGRARLITEYPSYRTERVNTPRHYPCTPREPGYNLWSLGVKALDVNPKPGVVIHNGSVTVRLVDMNPLVGLRANETPCRATFSLKVRMSFVKRATFTKFPKTEDARSGESAVLTVEGTS